MYTRVMCYLPRTNTNLPHWTTFTMFIVIWNGQFNRKAMWYCIQFFNCYSFDPCPKWREKFDPIASWPCYNTMLEPCLNLQKNCLKQTPLCETLGFILLWRLYFSLNSGKKRYQSLWLRNNFCLKVVACLQNKSDAVLPVDIVYGFQF